MYSYFLDVVNSNLDNNSFDICLQLGGGIIFEVLVNFICSNKSAGIGILFAVAIILHALLFRDIVEYTTINASKPIIIFVYNR